MTSPLLLLHGALGASAQFDPLIASLGDSLRIHTFDFEGHATSPPRDRPFRIEHFAENVVEYLERAQLESVNIFGYSMGGYVACYLALTQPQRVTRIATLGTKFRWDPETAERETKRLDPATIRAKVPRFADTLMARHGNAGGWERVLANTADSMRALGDHPLLTDETLAQIAVPVHVMVGDRDNTVSTEESEGVVRVLRAGQLTVLPNTPHPIEQVDVAALALILRSWLVVS